MAWWTWYSDRQASHMAHRTGITSYDFSKEIGHPETKHGCKWVARPVPKDFSATRTEWRIIWVTKKNVTCAVPTRNTGNSRSSALFSIAALLRAFPRDFSFSLFEFVSADHCSDAFIFKIVSLLVFRCHNQIPTLLELHLPEHPYAPMKKCITSMPSTVSGLYITKVKNKNKTKMNCSC